MTREGVLEALLRVFRDRGFEGATIAEIAKACGLSKASLYHHFPGGKEEMTEALVRRTLTHLQATAFAPLTGKGNARDRLNQVLDGLVQYLDGGARNCLLAVLALGTAHARVAPLLAGQFAVWIEGLEALFADAGCSSKAARRHARDLIARVQGGVVLARLLDDPDAFKQTVKRIARDIERL